MPLLAQSDGNVGHFGLLAKHVAQGGFDMQRITCCDICRAVVHEVLHRALDVAEAVLENIEPYHQRRHGIGPPEAKADAQHPQHRRTSCQPVGLVHGGVRI